MKKIGIIVEYNPLHNGHIYHINKIKEENNDAIIIAVMSSSFTMRGDLSVFNKFIKTKQALIANIDLVIELPFVYSINSSDIFAKYSVNILNTLGVDEIWCGSEQNDISKLIEINNIMKSFEYNSLLKEFLDQGLSYKKASINALKELHICELKSNDILALAYLDEIINLKSKILLKTIKRIGNNYNDKELSNEIYASATSLRLNKDLINKYVPNNVLNDYFEFNFLDYNKIFIYLKYQIMNLNLSELKDVFLVEEGIENSLKKIISYNNIDDYIASLTTKRYTSSRIKRMLLYILFNITKKDILKIRSEELTIRILGYNKLGRTYLNEIKKEINIITNIKDGLNTVIDIEYKISKILDLIYNQNLALLEQKGPITL